MLTFQYLLNNQEELKIVFNNFLIVNNNNNNNNNNTIYLKISLKGFYFNIDYKSCHDYTRSDSMR